MNSESMNKHNSAIKTLIDSDIVNKYKQIRKSTPH